MKTASFHRLSTAVAGGILLFQGSPSAFAQEEELNMAMQMQDRRIEGLTKLAEQIKNFNFLSLSQGLMKKLENRDLAEDPFGMAMDPENELPEMAAVEDAAGDRQEEEEILKTTLQEALTKLHITGVFPHKKTIMVGAQDLGVGDEIVIEYKETVFNLQILGITGSELKLRDKETQEEAAVAIGFSNSLPAGMSRSQPVASQEDAARQESTIVPMSSRSVTVE